MYFSAKPARMGLAASFGIVLLVLPYVFARSRRTDSPGNSPERTVTVEKKNFSRVLRVNGTAQATHSFVVLAPRLAGAQLSSLVITKMMPAGAHVKRGDVLVEFDPQAQVKDFLDKQKSFKDLVGQVALKQAEEDIASAKDDTALKQAEDELKRTQLEMQKSEIVSRIDAEKNREALDEAQATLKQLRETYELKRRAAAAGIHILEIQRDRAMEAMNFAQANAAKMIIHSPMDGVVVLNTIWLGGRMGTVQPGDEIRPGVPFLQVVDPSQMEVRAEINQADFLQLQPGLHAQIHLDAYPGLTLSAVLEELAPLGHAGRFSQKVRRFAGRFSIQGSDPRLLPDLSVALDVELASIANALVIPRESVSGELGSEFVWLKSGAGYEKRPIRTGPRNDLEVVAESGLAAGDVIRRTAREEQGAAAK